MSAIFRSRKFLILLVMLLLVSASFLVFGNGGLGNTLNKATSLALRLFMKDNPLNNAGPGILYGYTDTSSKRKIEPPKDKSACYCFLVFGQSNLANSSRSNYQPVNMLYNYYQGEYYEARSPLLGTTGDSFNPALQALDMFASARPGKSLILVPLAVSGTSILNWIYGGELHANLKKAIADLASQNVKITHVIYQQGEADCAIGTSPAVYKLALSSLLASLREYGVEAPIFVGQASLFKKFDCPEIASPDCYKSCPQICQAQASIVNASRNVFAGVDSDTLIGYKNRFDGYHFDPEGEKIFAGELAKVLLNHPEK